MRFKITVLFSLLMAGPALAQIDTSSVQQQIYNRPFIHFGSAPVALGGYMEGNTNYFSEDGVSEGFSMEFRRFNLFLYSAIAPRVRFLAEIEFEHGTEEIALETAQLDVEIVPSLQFRGGILLVPLGAFNQNHDSPKWEFVERPLVATEIIPSTLSEVGFGFHGILPFGSNLFTYDAYLVNGLGDGIILNEEGRTSLQNGKREDWFGEDNNGTPALTGRFAARRHRIGEIGASFYTGIYNSYRIEGDQIDAKRRLSVFAADFHSKVADLQITGELAYSAIEVPENISEMFGTDQWGFHLDFTYPVFRRPVFGFNRAELNAAVRLERVDFNVGDFSSTGANIHDDINAATVSLGFRPVPSTIIKANFQYHWIRDVLGNPTVHQAGFQFGIATYF